MISQNAREMNARTAFMQAMAYAIANKQTVEEMGTLTVQCFNLLMDMSEPLPVEGKEPAPPKKVLRKGG